MCIATFSRLCVSARCKMIVEWSGGKRRICFFCYIDVVVMTCQLLLFDERKIKKALDLSEDVSEMFNLEIDVNESKNEFNSVVESLLKVVNSRVDFFMVPCLVNATKVCRQRS